MKQEHQSQIMIHKISPKLQKVSRFPPPEMATVHRRSPHRRRLRRRRPIGEETVKGGKEEQKSPRTVPSLMYILYKLTPTFS